MRAYPSALERSYRRLLRCYPAAWRRRHEEEVLGLLLDQAEAEGRSSVSAAAALDLVGHGVEERLESLLRWCPARLRAQVALVALVAAAALSTVMLGAELVGAQARLPLEPGDPSRYFRSGPVLSTGVGLYLAFPVVALLVVLRHGGAARLLVLAAVAAAAMLSWPVGSAGYPVPRPMVLALFAGLGLLAGVATSRATAQTSRRLVVVIPALVGVVCAAVLLTQPWLHWSAGTMTTSGNVALAALATALPVVGGAAVLVAALCHQRHPGWSAAIAIAAVPVVIFCTLVSQSVNPAQATPRALIPLGYVLVVVAVAAAAHRGRRRAAAA